MRRWSREARALVGLFRLIRRTSPEVVYVNTLTGIAAIAASKMLRIPSVWHIRELFDDVGGEMHDPAFGGRSLVRQAIRRLPDRVIVPSQAVIENVLGSGNGADVRVIPNAVDAAFFEPARSQGECRRRLGIPGQTPVIGVPGTLRPVKGHVFFLEAAARLSRRMPECRFVISGEGTSAYRSQLDVEIGRHGLRNRVRLLGNVEDMRDFYQACDLVCVPSVSESFGRTVIEAFAVGVPVVASAVGGIKETVDDGETGLLVRYGDVEGLADALFRLVSDRPLASRLTKQARKKVWSEYREDIYQERICALVDELTRPEGRGSLSGGRQPHQAEPACEPNEAVVQPRG
jgi:glycosyltransferase involved in cell wall biosynthesis